MTEASIQATKTPGRGPRTAKAGSPRKGHQPKTPRGPEADSANAEAPAPAQPTAPRPPSKLDAVIALLRRPEGVTLDEIVAATGWQRHSARGALAGAVKKKLGASVVSERVDGVLRYRAPEASQ
jgi:hypothetical protein